MSEYSQLTIVGVGLIGGSIGLGLKQRDLAEKIVGVGRRQESLDRALSVGRIDEATAVGVTAIDMKSRARQHDAEHAGTAKLIELLSGCRLQMIHTHIAAVDGSRHHAE